MNLITNMKTYKVTIKDRKPITIKETKKCDTRAILVGERPSKDVVKQETIEHIYAVNLCGKFLCDMIKQQFLQHDHTKLDEFDKFYDALMTGRKEGTFKELEWWKIHETERHHLNDRVPDDVNLIDVLEMCCDCVSAGMARTGTVYVTNLDADILQKAFKNTMKLLQDNIEVKK